MTTEGNPQSGLTPVGKMAVGLVLSFVFGCIAYRMFGDTPSQQPVQTAAQAETERLHAQQERAEAAARDAQLAKRHAEKADNAKVAAEHVAQVMKDGRAWGTLVADLAPNRLMPEELDVMMTLDFEAHQKSERLAVAKGIMMTWQHVLEGRDDELAKTARLKLIDARGHKIGGSTMFTDNIEVDD